jgi:hypothetical protein
VRFSNKPPFLAFWIVAIWIAAAIHDYYDSLETVDQVLTAIAAVLLWPLLLFGFDIQIS